MCSKLLSITTAIRNSGAALPRALSYMNSHVLVLTLLGTGSTNNETGKVCHRLQNIDDCLTRLRIVVLWAEARLHGVISHKTAIFKVSDVRTHILRSTRTRCNYARVTGLDGQFPKTQTHNSAHIDSLAASKHYTRCMITLCSFLSV
jgi:hypothetical protein